MHAAQVPLARWPGRCHAAASKRQLFSKRQVAAEVRFADEVPKSGCVDVFWGHFVSNHTSNASNIFEQKYEKSGTSQKLPLSGLSIFDVATQTSATRYGHSRISEGSGLNGTCGTNRLFFLEDGGTYLILFWDHFLTPDGHCFGFFQLLEVCQPHLAETGD